MIIRVLPEIAGKISEPCQDREDGHHHAGNGPAAARAS